MKKISEMKAEDINNMSDEELKEFLRYCLKAEREDIVNEDGSRIRSAFFDQKANKVISILDIAKDIGDDKAIEESFNMIRNASVFDPVKTSDKDYREILDKILNGEKINAQEKMLLHIAAKDHPELKSLLDKINGEKGRDFVARHVTNAIAKLSDMFASSDGLGRKLDMADLIIALHGIYSFGTGLASTDEKANSRFFDDIKDIAINIENALSKLEEPDSRMFFAGLVLYVSKYILKHDEVNISVPSEESLFKGDSSIKSETGEKAYSDDESLKDLLRD